MKHLKSSSEQLKELFDRNITVKYIGEAFRSFDESIDVAQVTTFMDKMAYDVLGVSQDGITTGYAKRENLLEGSLGQYKTLFDSNKLVSDVTPLLDVFKMLQTETRVFVTSFGQVTGIVTKGDLQKPPVRMWLFGLISLLEMQMLRLLREFQPNDAWKQLLKEKRINEAEKIFIERRARNIEIDLADCLQFADKRDVLLHSPQFMTLLGRSKRSTKELFMHVQQLRDNLAHAQDIITGSWPKIAVLAQDIEALLEQVERMSISSVG